MENLQEQVDILKEDNKAKAKTINNLCAQVNELIKYAEHLPTCNIKQDWTEALQAMADTPTQFRDAGYQQAQNELYSKMGKCTCGLNKYKP